MKTRAQININCTGLFFAEIMMRIGLEGLECLTIEDSQLSGTYKGLP